MMQAFKSQIPPPSDTPPLKMSSFLIFPKIVLPARDTWTHGVILIQTTTWNLMTVYISGSPIAGIKTQWARQFTVRRVSLGLQFWRDKIYSGGVEASRSWVLLFWTEGRKTELKLSKSASGHMLFPTRPQPGILPKIVFLLREQVLTCLRQ